MRNRLYESIFLYLLISDHTVYNSSSVRYLFAQIELSLMKQSALWLTTLIARESMSSKLI